MNYTIDLSQDTKDFIKEMLKLYADMQIASVDLKKSKPIDENSPEYWHSKEGQLRMERIKEYNRSRGLI